MPLDPACKRSPNKERLCVYPPKTIMPRVISAEIVKRPVRNAPVTGVCLEDEFEVCEVQRLPL